MGNICSDDNVAESMQVQVQPNTRRENENQHRNHHDEDDNGNLNDTSDLIHSGRNSDAFDRINNPMATPQHPATRNNIHNPMQHNSYNNRQCTRMTHPSSPSDHHPNQFDHHLHPNTTHPSSHLPPPHHPPHRTSADDERRKQLRPASSSSHYYTINTPSSLPAFKSIGIPYTPQSSSEQLQFRYYCPICCQYYNMMYKTSCCSHYTCQSCSLAHLQTRTLHDTEYLILSKHTYHKVHTQQHIVTNKLINIPCIHCTTQPTSFLLVLQTEIPKNYVESPNTREAWSRALTHQQQGQSNSNASSSALSHTGHKSFHFGQPSDEQKNEMSTIEEAAAGLHSKHSSMDQSIDMNMNNHLASTNHHNGVGHRLSFSDALHSHMIHRPEHTTNSTHNDENPIVSSSNIPPQPNFNSTVSFLRNTSLVLTPVREHETIGSSASSNVNTPDFQQLSIAPADDIQRSGNNDKAAKPISAHDIVRLENYNENDNENTISDVNVLNQSQHCLATVHGYPANPPLQRQQHEASPNYSDDTAFLLVNRTRNGSESFLSQQIEGNGNNRNSILYPQNSPLVSDIRMGTFLNDARMSTSQNISSRGSRIDMAQLNDVARNSYPSADSDDAGGVTIVEINNGIPSRMHSIKPIESHRPSLSLNHRTQTQSAVSG